MHLYATKLYSNFSNELCSLTFLNDNASMEFSIQDERVIRGRNCQCRPRTACKVDREILLWGLKKATAFIVEQKNSSLCYKKLNVVLLNRM